MELIMKKLIFLLAAGTIAIAPTMTLAGPGGGHGGGSMGTGATMGQGGGLGRGGMGSAGSMGQGSMHGLSSMGPSTTHTSQGSTNGKGWDHMNGPTSTGQPGVECEDGVPPGNSSSAHGSAFNEDGVAHQHYAGEQPQNSRNTASSSQYDTACLRSHH
jgi:hypothetical protein